MAFAVCKCKSDFQDARYGKNIRVVNERKRPQIGLQEYRCTVCGSIHTKTTTPTTRQSVPNG